MDDCQKHGEWSVNRDADIDQLLSRATNESINGTAQGAKNGLIGNVPASIAICGLALRLPDGIRDARTFWDLLVNGKDSRSKVPANRYNYHGFDDTLGTKGAIKTQSGYFLDEDLTTLDTSFFSLTKTELEKTDPQQRQILEVTRECLESAGEVDYRGKLIGCYVGTFGEDWLQMNAKESQHSGGYIMTGHGDLMIANRVSYEFDFRGPSMVIKTGCSASLVGLHQACRALQNGDCTAALVAGTNLILGPTTTAAMTAEGILSPDGSCKTFDANADGFARGEAINAVYIKRLEDAIRDKNPIRAVIRNTSTNSDGKSASLMAPSARSHEHLIRKVYHDCGLDPEETSFVECHGTGTPTGDPIETTAVGNVFGKKGVFIGSVKPNVGHSEGASGITSLIKAVLILENGIIPPNIKFIRPNPKIPFREKNLVVPTAATAWPKGRKKRVSVNSFGIGGANAHVIVESFSDSVSNGYTNGYDHVDSSSSKLILHSANKQESLKRLIEEHLAYFEAHPNRVVDIAYTLALRREHLSYRAFTILNDKNEPKFSSLTKTPGDSPRIVMIFSGQGAQWPKMGAELMAKNEDFLKDIRQMDKILQSLIHPPDWSIEQELMLKPEESRIATAELAQPLCTALQIALVNALSRASVHPAAVVGHSSGEIAAAYASGVLSLSAALIVAYYRGFITKSRTPRGGMAAIGLGREEVTQFLRAGVVLACENSPNSTTISGDSDQVDRMIADIKQARQEIPVRKLTVDQAYHSYHMESISGHYLDLLCQEFVKHDLKLMDPRSLFFSSVTTDLIKKGSAFGPEYWKHNLISPVLFSQAISNLVRQKQDNLFLEIGPHATLAGPIRQILSQTSTAYFYIPTMLRRQDCEHSLLSAFGALFQHNIKIDLKRVISQGKVLIDLPRYPWDHSGSFWYENRVSKDWRFRKFGHHCLLGLRIPETTGLEPAWRNVLHLEDEPWLSDHKIRNDVIFPFAGYCTMAGEAVRQITGVQKGYSLRHVVASTAMVLATSGPTEIITTIRQHRLTDSSSSEWWEFVVSSFSGTNWIKNCEGQVKPNEKDLGKMSHMESLVRHVKPTRWYEAMANVGIVYGPSFQGLTSITSSTTENLATALINNTIENNGAAAAFAFHPTAIDKCLQLLLVALAKGVGRNFQTLRVPTVIEELDITHDATEMKANAWYSTSRKTVGIECGSNNQVALRLCGLRLTPLEDENTLFGTDIHAAARLEWRPHFDFINHSLLFKSAKFDKEEIRLQEEMTLLCMIDSAERLRSLETKQLHFEKFRTWLNKEIQRATTKTYPILDNTLDLVHLPQSERIDRIEAIFKRLSTMSNKGAVAEGTRRIWKSIDDIFTGCQDILEILMRDELLTRIYNVVSFVHSDFIQMLSHANPTVKILEVGAGTGGTTQTFLHDLIDIEGSPMYSLYTFTDISAGFFPQAKERFSYAPNMDFKVFDISKSPFAQSFERESYDLILAPNVIHATPNLKETLSNLQPLLRPKGRIVLTELTAVARTPNYIFGNFSGWWLGENDGRLDEPYVSVERWNTELKAAGFTGVETAVYDAEVPYQYCAAIVSQTELSLRAVETVNSIILLTNFPTKERTQLLKATLKNSGYAVSLRKLGEDLPADQDIVSILGIEDDFLTNVSQDAFQAFQKILKNQVSRNLLFVTSPTQVSCQNPRSAQSIGLARTVRSELASKFYTLEIDEAEPTLPEIILQVFRKVQESHDTESLLPDREYVFDEGTVKVGRYHPYSLQQELSHRYGVYERGIKSLEIGKPGLLETLQWIEEPFVDRFGDGEVGIKTRNLGLNFRDIVYAMGVISSESDKIPLGLELSGVVQKIGKGVKSLNLGDRVMALAPRGCIATDVILPASLVVKIPDSLSFESAATMPLCYVTVLQSLIVVGQLEKHQSVLIHSAAGGIGHAAIQVCKMLGAQIFVTVGNEEKRRYLLETFDIPNERIFQSHDSSFVQGLMRMTENQGVDIVLNSLSGELLHESWKCVKKFGKLIELGKRDLVGNGKLDMESFLANRSYCCVDVAQLIQERPERIGQLLKKLLNAYSEKKLYPIKLGALVEASDAIQAFRSLQKGDLIGKAIIQMPISASQILSVPRPRSLLLDSEASYLLTGGLGGLGKPLATWMVERGARSLIFLSRSAGTTSDDRDFFMELESMGCSVSAVPGKVQDMKDVQKALNSTSKPIKGVVHFAMVLKDAPIINMKYEDWLAATDPKVKGAWNLHYACANKTLDFFLLASSLVTIVDQPGQGNYNAANTFLEAFCQFRRSQGLAASVLNICPIEGIGFVAENTQARKNLRAQGLYFLNEQCFLDFVELSMLSSDFPFSSTQQKAGPLPNTWHSSSQFIMGLRSEQSFDDPNNRTNWRRDRRMAIYHNLRSSNTGKKPTERDALSAFLTKVSNDPDLLTQKTSCSYLGTEIGRKVFSFMLRPDAEVILSQTLTQIGLDSLMAIELRRWWKQVFGLEVSVLEIMAAGSLEQLGRMAAEGVRKRLLDEENKK